MMLYKLQKFQNDNWSILFESNDKAIVIEKYDEEIKHLNENEKLVVSLYGGAVKKSW